MNINDSQEIMELSSSDSQSCFESCIDLANSFDQYEEFEIVKSHELDGWEQEVTPKSSNGTGNSDSLALAMSSLSESLLASFKLSESDFEVIELDCDRSENLPSSSSAIVGACAAFLDRALRDRERELRELQSASCVTTGDARSTLSRFFNRYNQPCNVPNQDGPQNPRERQDQSMPSDVQSLVQQSLVTSALNRGPFRELLEQTLGARVVTRQQQQIPGRGNTRPRLRPPVRAARPFGGQQRSREDLRVSLLSEIQNYQLRQQRSLPANINTVSRQRGNAGVQSQGSGIENNLSTVSSSQIPPAPRLPSQIPAAPPLSLQTLSTPASSAPGSVPPASSAPGSAPGSAPPASSAPAAFAPAGSVTVPPDQMSRLQLQLQHGVALLSRSITQDLRQLHEYSVVSNVLNGHFRAQLEDLVQRRVEEVGNGPHVQEFIRSLRLNHTGSVDSVPNTRLGTQTLNDDFYTELRTLKVQMKEMHRMMQMNVEVQLDVQRAIRQEVAAVMEAVRQHIASQLQNAMQESTNGGATTSLPTLLAPAAQASERNHAAVAAGQCAICLDRTVDAVFYQCGHMCVCIQCGLQLKADGHSCPVCRASIQDVIRAYQNQV